jgi:hypothetical protein
MTKAIPFLVALVTLTISACQHSVQVRDRQRISSPQVGCAAPEIYITDRGTWAWTAECRRVIYECTVVSAHEAQCVRAGGSPSTTSGGSASPAPTPSTNATSDASPSPGPTTAPATDSPQATELRAAVEAQSTAILACVDTPPVGMSLTLAVDGSVSVRLTGARAGTNEEVCVRNVLAGLRAQTAPRAAETIIHVVR